MWSVIKYISEQFAGTAFGARHKLPMGNNASCDAHLHGKLWEQH